MSVLTKDEREWVSLRIEIIPDDPILAIIDRLDARCEELEGALSSITYCLAECQDIARQALKKEPKT